MNPSNKILGISNAINKIFQDKGCKITKFINKSIPIEYICKCGLNKKNRYRDFIKRNCRTCKSKNFIRSFRLIKFIYSFPLTQKPRIILLIFL